MSEVNRNPNGAVLDACRRRREAHWALGRVQKEYQAGWPKIELVLVSHLDPPIGEVIKAAVVPRLVEFLGRHEFPQLQALWALGNIVADSPSCRDLVLAHGALHPLLSQLNENSRLSVLRVATWTLCNLCHERSDSIFAQVKGALPFIQQLLYIHDEEVLRDACHSLCYLCDKHLSILLHHHRESVIALVTKFRLLLKKTSHPSPTVSEPVLYAAANILSGNDIQTQFLINRGVLHSLHHVLSNNHKSTIKVIACRAISNITARNTIQIQAVIDSKLVAPLIYLIQNEGPDMIKEAARAISNATWGSPDQIRSFLGVLLIALLQYALLKRVVIHSFVVTRCYFSLLIG
ncbi:hypothetical protein Dimus_012068 [Dionaea muscipula]